MFKTDKESLEGLSFNFSVKEIANLKALLEHLKSNDLLTISPEEVQRALQGLDAIGKLKLEGRVYVFHVYDSCAAFQSDEGEGVELYLRQGDELRELYVPGNRDFVYQIEGAVEILNKRKIPTIYTGEIFPHGSEFLGLPYVQDDEHPVIRDVLEDYEVEEFEDGGIQVVQLDSLI